MSLQETVLVVGMVSTLFPIVAIFLRDRTRYMSVPTLIAGVAIAIQLAVVLRLVQHGENPPEILARIFMGATFVALLGGYVISLGFGREDPAASLRDSRRILGILAFVGLTILAFLGSDSFLSGHGWERERGALLIGWAGKAYLTYALICVILIGYNLEKTYRIASSSARHRLRLPLVATFAALFYGTFVLTNGMLYSSLGLGKFVASALPIVIVNIVVGYGYLRGSLSDVAAPVSRTIVYSSFTAMTAGLFVAAVGLAGQVAGWTKSSPDEILVLAFGILVVLAAALLLFSNRFQRQVRRFIDRNFYVNRYDYRTQWSRVSRALSRTGGRSEVLDGTADMLRDILMADDVTIALRNRTSGNIEPVRGKGSDGLPPVSLLPETPLPLMLCESRKALLIDRKTDDFTFIPVYAENGDWLENTASQIIAPLSDGNELIGTLGMERKDADDPFTYEDVALLDSIAGHVTAAIRSAEMSEELAEAREVELMSNLSSMVLHDLKNYVTPLRLAASNLERFRTDPEAVTSCATDVRNVTDRMTTLIRMLSDLRNASSLSMTTTDVNSLVEGTLTHTGLGRREEIDLELDLQATRHVSCDQGMVTRVLQNLVTNALEAMPDGGRLKLQTLDAVTGESLTVVVQVEDTGSGMTPDFVRDQLFRPFATTKKNGLGLGLYQCRSIARLHGGHLDARSTLGEGSCFTLVLPTVTPQNAATNGSAGVAASNTSQEASDEHIHH